MKWLFSLLALTLASCATKEPVEATIVRKSPAVWVNGAEVYSNVEALKGVGAVEKKKLVYSASSAEFDGPMRWQFVAIGSEGEQLSMQIASVQVSTARTNRSVNVPVAMLGGKNQFQLEAVEKPKFTFKKKSKEEKEAEVEVTPPRWLATYTLPELMQLFPKADGKVTLAAKIVIETHTGTSSEWVNFALLPNRNKAKSFTFRQTMIEHGGVPID